MAFTFDNETIEGGFKRTLHGKIDENADITNIFQGNFQNLQISFASVEKLNSIGIKNWVGAIEKLPKCNLEYYDVSTFILDQFNLIKLFGQGGKIITLQIPYLCEMCEESVIDLTETEKCRDGDEFRCPAKKCPNCGEAMELDDDEDDFFTYISKTNYESEDS